MNRKNEEDLALYEEIKELQSEIAGNETVTKRRKTLEKLCALLRDSNVRTKIENLAIRRAVERGDSLSKARREAMSLFWTPIISTAFTFASRLVAGGKNKLTQQDIALPLSLVPLSDDGLVGNRIKLESTARLTEVNVKKVLKFCFDMLENDEAQNLAELSIMNTILFLCERVDYVAYFRPENEFINILATVEVSLLNEDGDEVSVAAAKIFGALIHSCYELGIALHLIMDQSLHMVAKWCKKNIDKELRYGGAREMSHLFRGVAVLIRFYPEQAVAPMERYGRVILSYAKRWYDKSDNFNRNAFHCYLIGHLVVSQEAGKLCGLLPGELGPLRRASIGLKQLDILLTLIMSSLSTLDLSFTIKKRTLWKPLDGNIRRHLELCARLMACAQRQYMVESEWDLIEDPDEFLAQKAGEYASSKHGQEETLESHPSSYSLALLRKSPWIQLVIQPLLQMVPISDDTGGSPGSDFVMNEADGQSQSMSQGQSPAPERTYGANSHRHPLLDDLSVPNGRDLLNSRKIIPLLYLIAACAETCPSGRCWTSSAQKYWSKILPDNSLDEDVLHVNACSPADLALLVQILSNLLEACGGSTADPELQTLSLLCLIRLTEAHAVLLSLRDKAKTKELSSLVASWRHVWTILFRSDLRYSASTANTSEGSCGELVVVLLTEMVHRSCTDPEITYSRSASLKQSTFLSKSQSQIWALPAFSKGIQIKSSCIFELICVFLHRLSLSEEGRDNIYDSAPFGLEEGAVDNEGCRALGRRYRLVCLCLRFLESLDDQSLTHQRQMLTSVTATLSALTNGDSVFEMGKRTYARGTKNLSWARSSLHEQGRFRLTELPDHAAYWSDDQDVKGLHSLFRSLWSNPLPDPGKSPLLRGRLMESARSDVVLMENSKLCQRIEVFDASSPHADYVPPATSSLLHNFVMSQVKELKRVQRTSLPSEEADDCADEDANAGDSTPMPLPIQTQWLKVSLSSALSGKQEVMTETLDRLSEEIMSAINRVKQDVHSLCGDSKEFRTVFINLLQILRFLNGLCYMFQSLNVPPAVLKCAASLVEVCDSLLGADSDEDNLASWDDQGNAVESADDDSESEGSNNGVANAVDLLSDDDDDDVVNQKRATKKKSSQKRQPKRKRTISRSKQQNSQPKRRKNNPKPPDQICACIIGTILTILEPSVSQCETVIRCLLGDHDQMQVDLVVAYHCLNLLCDKATFFHDKAVCELNGDDTQKDDSFSRHHASIVSMVCDVLDKLRKSAGPSSIFHMFGFQLCAKCVQLCDDKTRASPLSLDESKSLADRLVVNNDSVVLRPYLRVDRLREATAAFKMGGENFQKHFDSIFPKTFVLLALKDLNSHVRRDTCLAIAAALQILSGNRDRIVSVISKRLPPISKRDREETNYQDWYQHNELGSDNVDLENRVWEDAKASMECGALYCRGVIAGVGNEFADDILYDLVHYSFIRQDLEACCFHVCDKIAVMLGYEKAEDFIADESEKIIHRWLDAGEQLACIPLLLSSPSLLRLMLKLGKQLLLCPATKKTATTNELGTKTIDTTAVREHASDAFITRHKSYILPQILFRLASRVDGSEAEAALKTKMLEDRYLQDFCDCLKGKHDEETVKAIFSSRLHDIEAFCAPVFHSELEKVGKNVQRIVYALLFESDDEKKREESKRPHLTIRRILELSGKKKFRIMNCTLVEEAFVEAINVFVDQQNSGSKTAVLLSSAGTSITECFLYARQSLENATLDCQKEMRWRPLSILFELILAQIRNKKFCQTQLAFGVNILIDVILNAQLCCVRGKALDLLKEVLEVVLVSQASEDLKEELSFVFRRLMGCLMKTHDEAQREYFRICQNEARANRQTLQGSRGLLASNSNDENGGAWNWDEDVQMSNPEGGQKFLRKALCDFQYSDMTDSIRKSMTGAYEVLRIIFDNADGFGPAKFDGRMPPFLISSNVDQEELEKLDPRFSTQNFLKGSKVGQDGQNLSSSIRSLLDELRNRSSWMESASETQRSEDSGDGSTSLSMSQWMLQAGLEQLENGLRRQRIEGKLRLPEGVAMPLIQELAFVCGATTCPESLRSAASRCLGELDLRMMGKLPTVALSKVEDWIQKALETDCLLTGIQAQAMKVLAEYMFSTDSSIAIAAVDTLIALGRRGKDGWQMLDTKTQQALHPILSSKRRMLKQKSLPKPSLMAIKMKAGPGPPSDERDWCWNTALWQCHSEGPGQTSYEDWICALVSALIECRYNQAQDKKDVNEFFCTCQTIASIASGFATAIFPAIVLDLLESSEDQNGSSPKVSGVLEDTWIGSFDSDINSKLSESFETLLGKKSLPNHQSGDSAGQHPKAMQLAIDTLDLLRRATQARFQKSHCHKKNANAEKGVKRSRSRSQKDTSDSTGTDAVEYNKGLEDSIPWKGLPFGTVLRVDGELLVQACLNVQRHASALFYSDLYFDSFFRGSGAIMERLSDNFAEASLAAQQGSQVDVSGYTLDLKSVDASVVRQRALQSLKLLGDSYVQMHEEDAYQAVLRQASDLKSSGCDSMDAFEDAESSRAFFPSLVDLQRLDAMSNLTDKPVASSMCDTMEFLGLRNLLQMYIAGMDRSQSVHLSDLERRILREKWFESRLYGMKWDKALLDGPAFSDGGPSSIPGATSSFALSSPDTILGKSEPSYAEMGFHEAVTKALSAFARDDAQLCHGLLRVARGSLLHVASGNLVGDSSLEGLSFLIERLQALNDAESLVSKKEPVGNILKCWGFSLQSEIDPEASNRPLSGASLPAAKLRLDAPHLSAGFTPFMREAILRVLRFKSLGQSPQEFDPKDCLVAHLWNVCSGSRNLNHQNVAEAALYRLQVVLRSDSDAGKSRKHSMEITLRERLEEASLMESKNDFGFAIRLSKQAISRLREAQSQETSCSDGEVDALLVDSLIKCGTWSAKYKIEPARTILDSYHMPGAKMARSLFQQSKTPENRNRYLKAQIALAGLSSSLYDNVSKRVKSQEWLRAGKSLRERESERDSCQALIADLNKRLLAAKKKKAKDEIGQLTKEKNDLAIYVSQLLQEIKLAKRERAKIEHSVKEHLLLSVNSLAQALSIARAGEAMDMSRHLFRLVYLWLSNCSQGKDNTNLNSFMTGALKKIPSFRFVPLTSQLFAQIDQKYDSKFQQDLHSLVQRMCTEHPYHCLVQLISVCNGREVGSGVGGRNASTYLENMSDTKISAAEEIAGELERSASEYVGKLLRNYQVLMNAYILVANFSTAKLVENQQTKNIAFSIVSKSERLDHCLSSSGPDCLPCVLSSPPPVRSGGDYGEGKEDPIGGERINGFDSTFSITDSGLHRPKIVICQGTKGGRFRQLVKGEDEIRQDAVMEQVFTYVNDLMSRREDERGGFRSTTGQKKLRMVTYNIIPLSPSCGVLEWVENSTTFHDYILDTRSSSGKGWKVGAHSRYYPGEWGNSRCRNHYQQSPDEVKRETFDTICNFYSPVFRYFFVERFGHSLQEWYAAKMQYTRSCAVSSIVGHILGIGDRHCNNILVSQLTGEVIHIDFGIVFEQGKILTVPELVPFRLTRNIVDGFGPMGTEGTFSRSAEATAVVLRENANALLTILSAIASDPLYRWSVSPMEARRRQQLEEEAAENEGREKAKGKKRKSGVQEAASNAKETVSEHNEAAESALRKISEKLQGYEDGTSGEQQSIEGQVQLLINSARDPDNLSVMFGGWAPWV